MPEMSSTSSSSPCSHCLLLFQQFYYPMRILYYVSLRIIYTNEIHRLANITRHLHCSIELNRSSRYVHVLHMLLFIFRSIVQYGDTFTTLCCFNTYLKQKHPLLIRFFFLPFCNVLCCIFNHFIDF